MNFEINPYLVILGFMVGMFIESWRNRRWLQRGQKKPKKFKATDRWYRDEAKKEPEL